MNCEKCKYCIEVDCSNEINGYDSCCYCKYGLGDSYNDGYCNYPLIFIPIGILISKITTLFRIIKAKKTERFRNIETENTLLKVQIECLEEENKQLKKQIEKMKCCENCRIRGAECVALEHQGILCGKTRDKWELAE